MGATLNGAPGFTRFFDNSRTLPEDPRGEDDLLCGLRMLREDPAKDPDRCGIVPGKLSEKMKLNQSTVSDIPRRQRRLDVIEWIMFCRTCGVIPEAFLEELAGLLRGK
jgi:hypothetical protein